MKHHLLLHIALQAVSFDILLGAFSMERKHKVAKRFSKDHVTRGGHELRLMTAQHIHEHISVTSNFALTKNTLPYYKKTPCTCKKNNIYNGKNWLFELIELRITNL